MFYISIASILFYSVCYVYGNASNYQIPTPEFIVSIHAPNLQIILPDEEGIELFYFYGRLTKANGETIKMLMDTREKTNGAWMLFNSNVTIDVGDSITYWLYVKKSGVGYRMPYEVYHVKSVIGHWMTTTTTEYNPMVTYFTDSTRNPDQVIVQDPVNLDTVHETENVECKVTCENELKNMTNAVTTMQLHIESLEEMIINILQKLNQTKTVHPELLLQ
ncbi:hypothetical protein RN001_003191 [Aquatica leii]|uniref:CBM39 domain-containing protein n=1 Tax=Aquatica leii TaxID=1421715 RepID=A0AAN7SSZ4_9COLE|nr:hypothetical protein RN001_003191 [Aquatica leii]